MCVQILKTFPRLVEDVEIFVCQASSIMFSVCREELVNVSAKYRPRRHFGFPIGPKNVN